MRSLACALLLLTCLSQGCLSGGSDLVSLAEPTTPSLSRDYVDQVKRWSRRGSSIFDFDATLIVYATFHAPEFQQAFITKYLDSYKVNENARAQVRNTLMQAVAEGWVFHLESQSHTYELNELKPPKSVWRTTLIDDRGREVSPISITNDNSRPEVLQAFYPYTTIFARAWRVVFPKNLPDGSPLVGPDTKSLMVRIAGPPGNIEMVWRIK